MIADVLVLSTSLGGHEFRCKEISDDVCDDDIRLVYQLCDKKGCFTGPLMMTENNVAREIARMVCSSLELSGSLSVYIKDKDVAREFMQDCIGRKPMEYSFSGPQLSYEFFNWRNPAFHDCTNSGPMCLFGGIRAKYGESQRIDNLMYTGVSIDYGNDTATLAKDLGDLTVPVVKLEDWDHVVEPGSFRLVISIPLALKHDMETSTRVSTVDVPRDVALAICADKTRLGVVGVYTPNRDDAHDLMKDALNGSREPREISSRGILPFETMMFIHPTYNNSISPKVMYGQIEICARC